MGTDNKKASKGRPSSAGKRKGKFERYFATTAARKLRNVLKHNGRTALTAYKDWVFNAKIMQGGRVALQLPRETPKEGAA